MIFDKIKKMISELFFVDESILTLETGFAKDLEADSLDIVDLVMAIEDEFSIEVSDDEIKQIITVGDLVDYISRSTQD